MHRSASVEVVTSFNRSDCYRLERQLPGGVRTRWGTAPFHGARINQARARRCLRGCIQLVMRKRFQQSVRDFLHLFGGVLDHLVPLDAGLETDGNVQVP